MKVLVRHFNNEGTETRFGNEIGLKDIERIDITSGVSANVNKATITLKNGIKTRQDDGFLYTEYVDFISGENIFDEGQTVLIYVARLEDNRDIDVSDNSNDLIMSCEVQEIKVALEEGSGKLRLELVDKAYTLFNVLWSSTYTETDVANTAPLIIQNVVQWAGSMSGKSNVEGYDEAGQLVRNGPFAVDARLVGQGGFIEDTRPDDPPTAFPIVRLGKSFKPIYDWLDELSGSEYTNDFAIAAELSKPPVDRTMRYYVDHRNRFHWFYPKDEAATTLSTAISLGSVSSIDLSDASDFSDFGTVQIGREVFEYNGKSGNNLTGIRRGFDNTKEEAHASGSTVFSSIILTEGDESSGNMWIGSSFTKKTFDIVNSVIFNSGDDMNGSGILGFEFNATSSSDKGKMVYKAWTDISRRIKIDEKRIGETNGKVSITHTDADEYAFPSDYTDYGSGQTLLPWWNPGDATIDSDSTFNTSLRNYADAVGRDRAQALFDQQGSARWKGKIVLQFRRFTAGKIARVTSTRTGLRNKVMRINTVQYNISKDMAHTTLTLEEDEKRKGS